MKLKCEYCGEEAYRKTASDRLICLKSNCLSQMGMSYTSTIEEEEKRKGRINFI